MSVVLIDSFNRYSRKYFETVLGYQYGPPVTEGVMNAGYYLNEAEMQRVTTIKDHHDRFMAFLHLVERFSVDVTEYLRDCCKGTPTMSFWEMHNIERERRERNNGRRDKTGTSDDGALDEKRARARRGEEA